MRVAKTWNGLIYMQKAQDLERTCAPDPLVLNQIKSKNLELISPKELTEHHLLWLGNGKTSMLTFPNVPSNLTLEGILDNFCAKLSKDFRIHVLAVTLMPS